jgi:hypothetical protein
MTTSAGCTVSESSMNTLTVRTEVFSRGRLQV